MNDIDLHALEDRVARLHAALTAHPRQMFEVYDVKHEDDPWDWIPDLVAEVRRLRAERDHARATLRQVGDVWLAINRSEPNPDAIAVSLKNVAAAMCAQIDAALATPDQEETAS